MKEITIHLTSLHESINAAHWKAFEPEQQLIVIILLSFYACASSSDDFSNKYFPTRQAITFGSSSNSIRLDKNYSISVFIHKFMLPAH